MRNDNGQKIRIILKRTAELAPNSPTCIQIFNILMRQLLSDLGMKEIQRCYYAPDALTQVGNTG